MKRVLPLLVLVIMACGKGRRIDEKLMLSLEEARAWQHRADLHVANREVPAAIADVEQVLRINFPPASAEGEEARLDAWARLAQFHLGPAEADETRALADVERGRTEATRDTFYRAHLETVAGEILEARARRLTPAEAERARAVRKEALEAYARSIAINRRVQAALAKEDP
jgi:tetratricopeptide (TPR) repeat protein